MEHLFHHVQTWVPLVGARDPETKLLVDVDRCLQEFGADDDAGNDGHLDGDAGGERDNDRNDDFVILGGLQSKTSGFKYGL